MADTQRTRAQILALLADNVTGQVSAQDLRDVIVTIMESEFANPGDFWRQPSPKYTTTDGDGRGWIETSQIVGSDVSYTNLLYMSPSGIWYRADVADSGKTGIIGAAMNSYTSDTSTAEIMRYGVLYHSVLSATFSNFIGHPLYLASGAPGSMTTTITTSELIVGWIEASDDGGAAIGKFRFAPDWSIKGA
jgi:hypothetical protein